MQSVSRPRLHGLFRVRQARRPVNRKESEADVQSKGDLQPTEKRGNRRADSTTPCGRMINTVAEDVDYVVVVNDGIEEVILIESPNDCGDASSWILIEDENAGMECPVCFDKVDIADGTFLDCEHFFCTSCLKQYVNTEIDSLAASGKHIMKCPVPGCAHSLSEREIAQVVGQRMLSRFQQQSLEQVASRESALRFCPFPDCGYIYSLAEDERQEVIQQFADAQAKVRESTPLTQSILHAHRFVREHSSEIECARRRARMACPKCQNTFCIICNHDWNSCQCARQQKKNIHMKEKQQQEERLIPFGLNQSNKHRLFNLEGSESDIKFRECKRCGIKIEKESGCDKMKCRCGYRFCFHCGAENAQCNCTPAEHGFWDNELNSGDFSNLRKKKSPT